MKVFDQQYHISPIYVKLMSYKSNLNPHNHSIIFPDLCQTN